MIERFTVVKETGEIIPKASAMLRKLNRKAKEMEEEEDEEDAESMNDDIRELISDHNKKVAPSAQATCVIENLSFLLQDISTGKTGADAGVRSTATESVTTVKPVNINQLKQSEEDAKSVDSEATSVTNNTKTAAEQAALVPLSIWNSTETKWQGQLQMLSLDDDDQSVMSQLVPGEGAEDQMSMGTLGSQIKIPNANGDSSSLVTFGSNIQIPQQGNEAMSQLSGGGISLITYTSAPPVPPALAVTVGPDRDPNDYTEQAKAAVRNNAMSDSDSSNQLQESPKPKKDQGSFNVVDLTAPDQQQKPGPEQEQQASTTVENQNPNDVTKAIKSWLPGNDIKDELIKPGRERMARFFEICQWEDHITTIQSHQRTGILSPELKEESKLEKAQQMAGPTKGFHMNFDTLFAPEERKTSAWKQLNKSQLREINTAYKQKWNYPQERQQEVEQALLQTLLRIHMDVEEFHLPPSRAINAWEFCHRN